MWWLGIQIIISCVLFVVLYLLLQRRIQKQISQQGILSRQLEFNQQQLGQSQTETEELRSGIIGVGQRVLALESRIENIHARLDELTEKLQAVELTDPESKIYSRAVKMVELGADLEEIIRECELPHAEAELLFSLHKKRI